MLALGDMRELGEYADRMHSGLADAVRSKRARRRFLCGPTCRALWQRLPRRRRERNRTRLGGRRREVGGAVREGDVIAIKGSLGSKMKHVVDGGPGGPAAAKCGSEK